MLGTKGIEQEAVNAVRTALRRAPYLDANIDDNDKTPSFDGEVLLYEDEKKAKKDNLKVLRLQVKGKHVEGTHPDEITYPITLVDLSNYRDNGGLIFFVVYVTEQYDTTVYYQELTPVKIIHYLSEATQNGNIKSKTIPFKKLPNNPNELTPIISQCIDNCKKQASFSNCNLISIDQLRQDQTVSEYIIPITGYPNPYDPSILINADTYLYAKLKQSDILIPVNGLMESKVFAYDVAARIKANGVDYYQKFRRIHKKDGCKIQIGTSFSLLYKDKRDTNSIKFNYTRTANLKQFVRDHSFMIDCVLAGGFEINDIFIPIPKPDNALFNIEEQTKILQRYSRYNKLLEAIGCNDEMDIASLKPKDYSNLDALAEAVLDNVPTKRFNVAGHGFYTINIGTLQFALHFIPYQDSNDLYTIANIMSDKEGVYCIEDKHGEMLPVPLCTILQESNYISTSNIDFANLLDAYKRYPMSPALFEIANASMLRMISAYDKAPQPRKNVLLRTAYQFAEWLMEDKDSSWDSRIAKINYYQIVRRERELTIDEIDDIQDIIDESSDREDILVGCYILLGRHRQVRKHFDLIPEEDRNQFKQFPIYSLYQG